MRTLGFDLSAADFTEWWRIVWTFAEGRILPTVGIILIAALIYYPVRWGIKRVETRLAARTATDLDDHALRMLRSVLQISVFAWGAWRILDIWSLPRAAGAMDAIWIAALAFPVSGFVADVLDVVERRVVHRTSTALDDTALPLLNKVARFGILAFGLLLALDRIGLNIAPLLAGAGVMGLALSLAAKDTLSNLIAGVLLILDRPFQIGDRIELWNSPAETGSWGDVIEIGLRATKIRNPDNLVVVVPNNEIMRRDIINYTMSGPHIRLRIPIDVEYQSDIEEAKRIILGIALETGGVKTDPPPAVIVRGFGASGVNLQLRVWIRDARNRRAIADHITGRIVVDFADAGIGMPYPKRDVYVHNVPPAEETLASEGALSQ